MSAIQDDGSVQYGSRVITTVTGMETFVARNVEVTRPSTTIEVMDEAGEPDSQVTIPGFVTGTATLQLDRDPPALGDTFTSTFDSGIGSETFYVAEYGQTEEQQGQKLVNITFRKKYN